jgi:hypothetical protein
MASAPIYIGTPRASHASVVTANANYDGSGTLATIFTAGASGSRITTVTLTGKVAAAATQAADTVTLYIHDGTNARAVRNIAVPVGSGPIAAAVQNYTTTFAVDWQLPNAYSLRASTVVGGATGIYECCAFGGDY